MEIWGGIECTVNRVGDVYRDQTVLTGHEHRLEDLERLASLGIKKLRYPVIWERVAPEGLDKADWRWTDERLARLRALGIEPIVTLCHHGSGPRSTNLLEPSFATGLAAFARAAAERYPWVEHWTPVNEPLTTARFSALYGFWHPHAKDDRSFTRALVNEIRGTILAMEQIRAVNPAAKLIQSEDFGATFATPMLQYQADMENERRWLSLDLLHGRARRNGALEWYRPTDEELAFFEEHACPPDVIGLNYYLTSERFLDHRLERYPTPMHGGNGKHAYADVEAVRVMAGGITGHLGALRLAWERYGAPLAFTEVHLGCTREEQLRWLHEAHAAALQAGDEGIDVRAVTAWALLGSVDWTSLLTRENNHYEPGAFDVRSGAPRETAIAKLVRTFAKQDAEPHPVSRAHGWWRRDSRLLYPSAGARPRPTPPVIATPRTLLITGASGTLGRAFARACEERALPYLLTSRGQLDITGPEQVRRALAVHRPWAVINAAGWSRVDAAERESNACVRANAVGPRVLAEACAHLGIPLVTFSSDMVFDGASATPYHEEDAPNPLNVYGRSKVEGETAALATHPGSLVVRTSSLFGPWDPYNFVARIVKKLRAGELVRAPADHVMAPTYVPHLVGATLDLLLDGESGLWHLANRGALSWEEFAREVAHGMGAPQRLVVSCSAAELGTAPRPRYSVLGSSRGQMMPMLETALSQYFEQAEHGTERKVAA